MVLPDCDPETKECERNTVKSMLSKTGAFLCVPPHHPMMHPHATQAHLPDFRTWMCLCPKSWGQSSRRGKPGLPKIISGGNFPRRGIGQWSDQAHTSPMGLDFKKITCSRRFSIVWLPTVGFRKQEEASSGKCLQRSEEDEVKVTAGQHDGEWWLF